MDWRHSRTNTAKTAPHPSFRRPTSQKQSATNECCESHPLFSWRPRRCCLFRRFRHPPASTPSPASLTSCSTRSITICGCGRSAFGKCSACASARCVLKCTGFRRCVWRCSQGQIVQYVGFSLRQPLFARQPTDCGYTHIGVLMNVANDNVRRVRQEQQLQRVASAQPHQKHQQHNERQRAEHQAQLLRDLFRQAGMCGKQQRGTPGTPAPFPPRTRRRRTSRTSSAATSCSDTS